MKWNEKRKWNGKKECRCVFRVAESLEGAGRRANGTGAARFARADQSARSTRLEHRTQKTDVRHWRLHSSQQTDWLTGHLISQRDTALIHFSSSLWFKCFNLRIPLSSFFRSQSSISFPSSILFYFSISAIYLILKVELMDLFVSLQIILLLLHLIHFRLSPLKPKVYASI